MVLFTTLTVALFIAFIFLSKEEYEELPELEQNRNRWVLLWIVAAAEDDTTELAFAVAQYECARRLIRSKTFWATPWLFILRRYEVWRIRRITRSRRPISLHASTTVSRSGWIG